MAGKRGHRGFGHVRKLPSGRHQASYIGPDLARHTAGLTFDTRFDADAWLVSERRLIQGETWSPPAARRAAAAHPAKVLTLRVFADEWWSARQLKPRTRAHYRSLLDRHILPGLGDTEVGNIDPAAVRAWHAATLPDAPTLRAHSYSLLRTVLNAAVADRIISHNPCTLRGAGNSRRVSKTEPATLEELAVIVESVPTRYRLMTLLAAWTALRFGELTELRNRDVDVKRGVLRIRRGVTWEDGQAIIGTPKSDAGTRDVAIPPHLLPVVREHLQTYSPGRDDLLFPAGTDATAHMRPGTLYRVYYRARDAAGRPDLRFHDLRHTGAVLAAATGASLAELMGRLGHSTPSAALKYQSVARGRDQEIARLLSDLASNGEVTTFD